MSSVLYIHHPASLRHDPQALSPEHPDHPARLHAIEAAIAAARLENLRRLMAPAATETELSLVHTARHVAFIRDLCAAGGGQIDADTYVGEASYEAALRAAGGACVLVRALISGEAPAGFCALRPAGHHAEPDRAMGFCLFNNVAIAAELAIRELGVRKVMIIDWDVHHGNGTAEIFRHRPDVLVAGIHQSGLFPGTGALADTGSGPGQGYTVNLPVPSGRFWRAAMTRSRSATAWWRRSRRWGGEARRNRRPRTRSSPPARHRTWGIAGSCEPGSPVAVTDPVCGIAGLAAAPRRGNL